MEPYRFIKRAMDYVYYPAFTLMVITRRDLGYRVLKPTTILLTFGVLSIIAILATPGHEADRPMDILLFSGFGFFAALVERNRREKEHKRGIRQHSYYIGTSTLEFHWLPNFIRRDRRVARIVDPIFWTIVGFLLLPYSRALGIYLIFAASCLRVFEHQLFQRERKREFDMIDSLIEAQGQAQTLDQHEEPQNPQRHFNHPGVPTGLGKDIQKKIQKQNPSLN